MRGKNNGLGLGWRCASSLTRALVGACFWIFLLVTALATFSLLSLVWGHR
jgi:hypothetical protein